ncbi:hypothetical protein [Thalassotalea ganghwensis]
MLHNFSAITLSCINAAGSSPKALSAALTTQMFFGEKQSYEILANNKQRQHDDEGIAQPYFAVPIDPVMSLSKQVKMTMLLTACFEQTAAKLATLSTSLPLNAIEEIVVVTSSINKQEQEQYANLNEENDWHDTAVELLQQTLPQFVSKLRVCQVGAPALDKVINLLTQQTVLTEPKLVVCVDTFVDFQSVKALNEQMFIHCAEGEIGVMPGEGACCMLLLPETYPNINVSETVQISPIMTEGKLSLKEQLQQAGFSLPKAVIHTGSFNEIWVRHWYQQTQQFYHVNSKQDLALDTDIEPELTLFDQTRILGYLGSLNLVTGLASASALLNCPFNNINQLWLIEYYTELESADSLTQVNVFLVSKAGVEQKALANSAQE